MATSKPLVAVLMGSLSDWETMKHTTELLTKLSISYHAQVLSAHRTPDLLSQFGKSARQAGYEVIIAAAGGAAHLPGMMAAFTSLPVIGVPMQTQTLNGLDSLLSIVQMPAGIPVATVAIGLAGAKNAALLAASILSTHHRDIAKALESFRQSQTQTVLDQQNIQEKHS